MTIAAPLRAREDEMSEYWNAVACGSLPGFVVGFFVGIVWATHTFERSRRKADDTWDK